jgi:hypothetical protein
MSRKPKIGFAFHDATDELGTFPAQELWFERSFAENKWIAAYRLILYRGSVRVGEVRVFPREAGRREPGTWSGERRSGEARVPGSGLNARLIRQARFGADMTELRGEISRLLVDYGPDLFKGVLFGQYDLLEQPIPPKKTGKAGTPDKEYLLAASLYAEAIVDPKVKSPIKYVQARMSLASPENARDLVHEARRRNLLTATTPGKAGGELTPKAKALRAQARKRKRRGDPK